MDDVLVYDQSWREMLRLFVFIDRFYRHRKKQRSLNEREADRVCCQRTFLVLLLHYFAIAAKYAGLYCTLPMGVLCIFQKDLF